MLTQLSLSRSSIYDTTIHLCRKCAPLALALITLACSGNEESRSDNKTACNDVASPSVKVVVLGAGNTQLDAIAAPEGGAGGRSGTQECLAVVTAKSRYTTETLDCFINNQGNGNDCVCDGLFDQYGSVSVTVQLGERVQTQTAEVGRTEDGCYPQKETLTFFK